MGYVAVKGGTEAILHTEALVDYFRLKGGSEPLHVRQIQDQLRLAVDRTMSEGALYAPELAALALKQSEGDALEASFLLRAYRSTVPRIAYSLPVAGERMRALRRISATFRDLPGGQILGPSRDYHLRLLKTSLRQESSEAAQHFLSQLLEQIQSEDLPEQPQTFPKIIESMRTRGLLTDPPAEKQVASEPYDITRQALTFPAPRSARLQALAQADTGGILAFAYSSVRGYGDVHPTLGELRYGYLPVEVAHPLTGEPVEIGEILATECEMVSRAQVDEQDKPMGQQTNLPRFGLGYGFCFGQCEVKAISMSTLDRALSAAKEESAHGESGPAANEEFVLLHADGIEASGFTAHFKLPHYVTFQADISVLERAREHRAAQFAEAMAKRQEAVAAMDLVPASNGESERNDK